MEEILASIRRILADGQGLWSGPQERQDHDDIESNRSDVMNVIESKTVARDAGGKPAQRSTFSRPARGEAEDTEPRREDPETAPGTTQSQGQMPARRGAALASAATEASVAAAFQTLVASRFAHDTELVADLTRELIRPLLEAWIDAHLPGIVERLVAAEIARIARGE
jgi:hypothetical protein